MSLRTAGRGRHTPRSNPRSRQRVLYVQITCARHGDGTSKEPRAAMLAHLVCGTCNRAVVLRGLV